MKRSGIQIQRIYSNDPKDWEKVVEFLVIFAKKIIKKKPPF